MVSTINALAAREHVAELLRDAQRQHVVLSDPSVDHTVAVELRLAGPRDAQLIRRLAELDDAPELTGPALIALIGGEAVAALSLLEDRVVANPFVRSSEAVALLRVRAEHLSNTGRRAPRRRRLRLPFTRATKSTG